MISKKVFCDTLTRMEFLDNVEQKVNAVFEENKIDFNGFSYYAYEDLVFNILTEVMEDKSDGWISYWIFDLNYGTEYDKENGCRAYNDDGSIIPLRTAGELYDFILTELDKKKKV